MCQQDLLPWPVLGPISRQFLGPIQHKPILMGSSKHADAGNGVATAGKPSTAKAAKPSKPTAAAAKRGASKSAANDQRGIMSFFGKK